MPPHDPSAAPAASGDIAITWTFTLTYTHQVPLDAVAHAAGQTADELAANPESLLGAAGPQLANLLTGHQEADRVLDEPEVEIITAEFADTPTLAELFAAARRALRADPAEQPTEAGRALAALLAGLRREEVINQ